MVPRSDGFTQSSNDLHLHGYGYFQFLFFIICCLGSVLFVLYVLFERLTPTCICHGYEWTVTQHGNEHDLAFFSFCSPRREEMFARQVYPDLLSAFVFL